VRGSGDADPADFDHSDIAWRIGALRSQARIIAEHRSTFFFGPRNNPPSVGVDTQVIGPPDALFGNREFFSDAATENLRGLGWFCSTSSWLRICPPPCGRRSAVGPQHQQGSPVLRSAWPSTLCWYWFRQSLRFSWRLTRWSGASRRKPRPSCDQAPPEPVPPAGRIVEPRAEIYECDDRCSHHIYRPLFLSSVTGNQNVIGAAVALHEDSFGFVASFGQHRG
jgi:hypothetical protein